MKVMEMIEVMEGRGRRGGRRNEQVMEGKEGEGEGEVGWRKEEVMEGRDRGGGNEGKRKKRRKNSPEEEAQDPMKERWNVVTAKHREV